MDYNQSEVLSCYYSLFIGGKEISFDAKQLIESITIKESASQADSATIIFNDVDFKLIEDDIFIKDVPIKIEGGWNEEAYRFEFNGYIAAIDIDFGDRGYPTVILYCMDATHKMNREKKYVTWKGKTSSEVVEMLAQSYGFKVEIQPPDYKFKREESIAQSIQTDIQFLRDLASKETDLFVCTLKNGDTLYYGKRGLLSEPVADLWYKQETREIITFRPRINRETKREEVKKADINPQTKQIDKAVINDSNANRQTQGTPVQTSSKRRKYDEDGHAIGYE